MSATKQVQGRCVVATPASTLQDSRTIARDSVATVESAELAELEKENKEEMEVEKREAEIRAKVDAETKAKLLQQAKRLDAELSQVDDSIKKIRKEVLDTTSAVDGLENRSTTAAAENEALTQMLVYDEEALNGLTREVDEMQTAAASSRAEIDAAISRFARSRKYVSNLLQCDAEMQEVATRNRQRYVEVSDRLEFAMRQCQTSSKAKPDARAATANVLAETDQMERELHGLRDLITQAHADMEQKQDAVKVLVAARLCVERKGIEVADLERAFDVEAAALAEADAQRASLKREIDYAHAAKAVLDEKLAEKRARLTELASKKTALLDERTASQASFIAQRALREEMKQQVAGAKAELLASIENVEYGLLPLVDDTDGLATAKATNDAAFASVEAELQRLVASSEQLKALRCDKNAMLLRLRNERMHVEAEVEQKNADELALSNSFAAADLAMQKEEAMLRDVAPVAAELAVERGELSATLARLMLELN